MATKGYGSNGKVGLSDQFFLTGDALKAAKSHRPSFTTDNKLDLATLKGSADKLFAWAQKHKDVPGVATNTSLQALVNGYNNISDFDDANKIVAKNKKAIGTEIIEKRIREVRGNKYAPYFDKKY